MLSVGCGWHPGRHLFPAPAWRMTGADVNADMVGHLAAAGEIDAGRHRARRRAAVRARARSTSCSTGWCCTTSPTSSRSRPVFDEAARLLRPGGALVVIEPGLWHPVGAALALANRAGLGVWAHGTPDDIPLSPRALAGGAAAAGLDPSCTRSPTAGGACRAPAQRALHGLDRLGSRPRLAPLGHTLLLIGRRYSTTGSPKPGRSNGGPAATQPSRS